MWKVGAQGADCQVMAVATPAAPALRDSPKSVKSGGMEKRQFLGKCFTCRKVGHMSNKCWKNKTKDKANVVVEHGSQEKSQELGFVSIQEVLAKVKGEELTQGIFLGDSATSSNMTNENLSMYNCKSGDGQITVRTGESAKTSIVGDIDVTVIRANEKEYDMTLTKVNYVPEIKVNLISWTRYMLEGWTLSSDKSLNIKSLLKTTARSRSSGRQLTDRGSSLEFRSIEDSHLTFRHGWLGRDRISTCCMELWGIHRNRRREQRWEF